METVPYQIEVVFYFDSVLGHFNMLEASGYHHPSENVAREGPAQSIAQFPNHIGHLIPSRIFSQ
jgi:hypothetical protein